MSVRLLRVAFCFALAASFCSSGCLRGPAAVGPLKIQSLGGTSALWQRELPKDAQTLVVFMTAWCESCERKQPQVLRWARAHQKAVKTFFVISGSPLREVKELARKRKIPGALVKVLVDGKGAVARYYQVNATPTYILLNRSGRVLGRFTSLHELPKG